MEPWNGLGLGKDLWDCVWPLTARNHQHSSPDLLGFEEPPPELWASFHAVVVMFSYLFLKSWNGSFWKGSSRSPCSNPPAMARNIFLQSWTTPAIPRIPPGIFCSQHPHPFLQRRKAKNKKKGWSLFHPQNNPPRSLDKEKATLPKSHSFHFCGMMWKRKESVLGKWISFSLVVYGTTKGWVEVVPSSWDGIH